VLLFTAIAFLVTVLFHANVDAQAVPTPPVCWC
jgi:hypothetical protein